MTPNEPSDRPPPGPTPPEQPIPDARGADHARVLSWATLLAQWTDFARAAVALPDTPAGARWKSVVADIIGLQAHVHALAELRTVAADERALALDRASIAIRDHTSAIHAAWQAEPIPEGLVELIDDARLALRRGAEMGVAWIADADVPAMPSLDAACAAAASAGLEISLWVARPGTPMFAGTPIAQLVSVHADDAKVFAPISASLAGIASPSASCRHVQVYREVDMQAGRPVRDLIVPMDETLPAGQPLLEQRVGRSGDERSGMTVMASAVADPARHAEAQRSAMGGAVLAVVQPESPWLVEDARDGA